MRYYHVTKKENVQSILEHGVRPSASGVDGPGVYMWKGPLAIAVSEADSSLSDNHYKMTDSEYADFKRQLAVMAITLPSDAQFSVEYPEYVVYKDGVPASCVTYCGELYELTEKLPNRHGLLLDDTYGIEDGNTVYTVSLEPGFVVDVKVCAKTSLVYIMQNNDGSSVHSKEDPELTFPDYRYNEASIVNFVKEEHMRRKYSKPSLSAQIQSASIRAGELSSVNMQEKANPERT